MITDEARAFLTKLGFEDIGKDRNTAGTHTRWHRHNRLLILPTNADLHDVEESIYDAGRRDQRATIRHHYEQFIHSLR